MTSTEPEPDEGPDPNALLLENALLRAGVNLDSDQGQILQRSWTGRTPDIEAIRREWTILQPPAPTPEAPPPPAADERIEGEANQAEERQLLAGQPSSVVADTIDVRSASVEAGREVLRKGGTPDDAIATGFHMRGVAAANGDSSVVVVGPDA